MLPFLGLLPSYLLPVSLAFGYSEGAHPPREIGLYLNFESGAKARFLPPLPPEDLEANEAILKNNTQPMQINKASKSRLSRAMKARARMRQQHRIRSLFVARNK
jgi:hypothetical protein